MSWLEVSRLSKRFGRTNAVVDVSFEVEAGTVLGLAGPNGAGKSTVLRMLATILRPTKGQITIGGLDAIRKARKVRGGIGYVPDVYSLYDDTKVWEYLAFFARCYHIGFRERQPAIAEILKLVDLFDLRFAYCRSLSRGQQQKLIVARALLHDPALLVLDEPLAGLDAQSRLELLEVFRELATVGKAIVISSHSIADLVDVCDRIGLMAAGQLTTIGTVPELIRELDVSQRMRLIVLEGQDLARRILSENHNVSEIEMGSSSLTFTCGGGRTIQASVLQQLVQQGVKVAQFAPLNQAIHDLVAMAPATPVSPDQFKP